MAGRCDEKASHMRKTKISVATREMIDPIEDMVFQRVYASG